MCQQHDMHQMELHKPHSPPTSMLTPHRRRKLALLITLQCLSIPQLYLYLSGSSAGRTIFRHAMDYLLPNADDNVKAGGLILVVFAVPLLVAGVACALRLNTSGDSEKNAEQLKQCEHETASPNSVVNGEYHNLRTDSERISESTSLILLHEKESSGKYKSTFILKNAISNPRQFALVFVVVPCLVFYACNICRHYELFLTSLYPNNTIETEDANIQIESHQSESNYNHPKANVPTLYRQLLQHVANDSAIMALVAMAYLLVPVSKQGPLLVRWSPVEVLVIHKWAGRLGIFGCVLHGGLHLICGYWRWWNAWTQTEDRVHVHTTTVSSWYGYYLPPWSCWRSAMSFGDDAKDSEFGYGCYQETMPCQCYDFFLNLTGLLGMAALVILGCSSVGYVRRHHYMLFYL